jgi:hypothetical protein
VRRLGLTTWLVLALCSAVGIIAVAMTVVVILRLNRQVLASAAEFRTARPAAAAVDSPKGELIQYAVSVDSIEDQWASAVAGFQARYPNNVLYQSVATAQTVEAVNKLRRPTPVAAIHERLATAWSDRDAAFVLLSRPNVGDADRQRAAELARKADDELRRVRNDLRDLLQQQGITDQDVASARS